MAKNKLESGILISPWKTSVSSESNNSNLLPFLTSILIYCNRKEVDLLSLLIKYIKCPAMHVWEIMEPPLTGLMLANVHSLHILGGQPASAVTSRGAVDPSPCPIWKKKMELLPFLVLHLLLPVKTTKVVAINSVLFNNFLPLNKQRTRWAIFPSFDLILHFLRYIDVCIVLLACWRTLGTEIFCLGSLFMK